jgi:hypothetical protein
VTRHSSANLRRRIDDVLVEVRQAQAAPNPHPFLGAIEQSLADFKNNLHATQEVRARMAGGLGRIVTDDYAFSESRLGDHLLRVINDFGGISEDD